MWNLVLRNPNLERCLPTSLSALKHSVHVRDASLHLVLPDQEVQAVVVHLFHNFPSTAPLLDEILLACL